MKKVKYLFALLMLIPLFSYAFIPIPRVIYGVSFVTPPEKIPSLVNYRVVAEDIDLARGSFTFIFDNLKDETIEYYSRYEKIYLIKRNIGMYGLGRYHFKVLDFINAMKKRYGPGQKSRIYYDSNYPEHYFVNELTWEDAEIVMKLKTLFFASSPKPKYIPGINGRDIIIEYTSKINKSYIYKKDNISDRRNILSPVW
jgi:hypothetical protein